MSLMERVVRAQQGESSARSPIRSVAPSETARERLRSEVLGLLPTEEIAASMATRPEWARSEIRRACREVLAGPAWAFADEASRSRLIEEVIDSVFGFGLIEDLLEDDTVTEIMINGTSSIYFERDGRLHRYDRTYATDEEIRALVDRIIGPLGRRIDEASPKVNARLPQGHRVHAIIAPLSLSGTVVTIRKFASAVMTLAEIEEAGSFPSSVRQLLAWAVRTRKNIAVSGGTGSGKTTLLNALSCEIPHDERVVTIEDSAELRFSEHPHVVSLEARPRNAEGFGEVGIRDLVIDALRMRPDRIIVGECRGAEALDMLQAMNTGHAGSLTTLHANSPVEAVSRLTTMVRFAADLPVDVIESSIALAFDLVVQTARSAKGNRYVSEIASFSFDRDRRACVVSPMYRRLPASGRGEWVRAASWLEDAVEQGVISREEVGEWMASTELLSSES